MKTPHIPVLLKEVLSTFSNNEEVLIDCTFGFGGMSKALLEQNKNLKIIGIDRDADALEFAYKNFKHFIQEGRLELVHKSYANALKDILSSKKIDAILADIGVSSFQLDSKTRGFSFKGNTLDMRMDVRENLNASYILNNYNAFKLANLFEEYGEIKDSKKLANKIKEVRAKQEINKQILDNIINELYKKFSLKYTTLIYQALRIEVNSELLELKNLLSLCKDNLKEATLAIISFHSLEDRLIKDAFKLWSKECICKDYVFKCECGNNNKLGDILYKKPLIASKEELSINPRARSAKLRAFKFTKKIKD